MLPHSLFILLSLLSVSTSAKSSVDLARLNRLGALSPYHKAPSPEGVEATLPSDCNVDQVMYLSRHGSRYPSHEAHLLRDMSAAVARASEYIAKADLPEELMFLKEGYVSDLGEESLVEMGRQQLFKHGQEFRKKYSDYTFDKLTCSNVSRVIESADHFGRGYFEIERTPSSLISTIPVDPSTPSRVTPWPACRDHNHDASDNATEEWGSVYLPPIAKRLNALVPGLNFTSANALGALGACGYDYAAHEDSPWCNVFTDDEIDQYEYDIDLLMSSSWGSRLPKNMGAVMGSLYVNTLIDRFSKNDTKVAFVEFGHDVTISLTLTALGLTKDVPPVSTTSMTPNRKYRGSNQTPFAAQMVFEKFTCSYSSDGPQIRLTLNEAPFPLTMCEDGLTDARYGSCSFDNFVKANDFVTSVIYGGKVWEDACGPVA
ncbi:hypothetical protein ONZ45_g3962 [Pleurotus djamor]|nr:hypothetical protein ONZ45_g3962 [Pleurotus djamor]